MTSHSNDWSVLGVVLSGGRSRRFSGGDKAFQILAGRSLIERVVDRATPQVTQLLISANGDPSRFSSLGARAVIADELSGHQGPLAGLAAAISWLSGQDLDLTWIATFPVDGPFLPIDLVKVLLSEAADKGVPAVASSQNRVHPIFGVWPVGIGASLRHYLGKTRRESLKEFVVSQQGIFVEFETRVPDPFFNINTPEDLMRAQDLASEFDLNAESGLNR